MVSLVDCLLSREAGEADWWHQFIAISQKELSEEMARPTENKGKSHRQKKSEEMTRRTENKKKITKTKLLTTLSGVETTVSSVFSTRHTQRHFLVLHKM